MANEPINPHDAFFKQYLSHPPVAADFLRHQQIKDEASLNQLVDIALEVFILPDFVVKLQEFVPHS